MEKFNLGWGNPHFLLEILEEKVHLIPQKTSFSQLIYGPYEGMSEMIDYTRRIIHDTTGQSYKHILMTNGASHAINCILRKFKRDGGIDVHTSLYGYPSYEDMIKRADLQRIKHFKYSPEILNLNNHTKINLIDSPSNPFGTQHNFGDPSIDIWDSVYHSKIYTLDISSIPKHKYMVGSYSKLLGVAGARVGWIATDDTLAYERLLTETRNENTGVSRLSQEFILDVIDNLDLELFMEIGQRHLNDNRTQFEKIKHLFDGQEVNSKGMFYCAKVDPKALDILKNAGIEYIMLDEETIRLSMGHKRETTKEAIKAIIREDQRE